MVKKTSSFQDTLIAINNQLMIKLIISKKFIINPKIGPRIWQLVKILNNVVVFL